jgi:hypothetical protein
VFGIAQMVPEAARWLAVIALVVADRLCAVFSGVAWKNRTDLEVKHH